LEALNAKKRTKAKARLKIREGYIVELKKLSDELSGIQKQNDGFKQEKQEKDTKINELQGQIKEMKDLLNGLRIAKEGLNKYVENPKKIEEKAVKQAVVRSKVQNDPVISGTEVYNKKAVDEMKAASIAGNYRGNMQQDDDEFWYSNPQESIFHTNNKKIRKRNK